MTKHHKRRARFGWTGIFLGLLLGSFALLQAQTAGHDHSAHAQAPAAAETPAQAPSAAKQQYTCPMHPEIIRDAPGSCPICGMYLVPVKPPAEKPAAQPEQPKKPAASAATPSAATAEASGAQAAQGPTLYTCGMHPQIIRDKPGNCPICGMKLEPVRKNAGAGHGATGQIFVDQGTIQRMNLKTATVSTGTLTRTVRAPGIVAFDEGRLYDVTLKYDGWIEKLHVDTPWSEVKAGEPLFAVYSPELYNAATNYQTSLRAEPKGGTLTQVAAAKLALFDVSPAFLKTLADGEKAPRLYDFPSPIAGVVAEKDAVQGQMVKAGQRIYRIADLGTVWVNAELYGTDADGLKAGDTVEILPEGAVFALSAKVLRVIPQVQAQTRTVQVRLGVDNADGKLRPGAFVTARFARTSPQTRTIVNDSAVLRSGEKNTVFIALPDGGFAAREVVLGERGDNGDYAVISGLEPGERIVVSGQFLLDSESRLREAIQKLQPAAETPGAPPAPAASPANAGHVH